MFKLIIEDTECFGPYGYYTTRMVAFGKSPKQCYANMRRPKCHTVSGGHPNGYGGIPVMKAMRLEKNGQMVSETWG